MRTMAIRVEKAMALVVLLGLFIPLGRCQCPCLAGG